MSAPKVSIIVPVYNSAQYLPDCLNSLLAQELPSFEVICVDDGSTDASPRILAEYASRYPQIRVIRQENAGVSAARNHGLALARGTYVYFCDSDDCLLAGILKQALAALEKGSSLCFFEMKRVPAQFSYCGEKAEEGIPVTQGLDAAVQNNLYVFTLLIQRDVLMDQKITFREGLAYSEDELFVMDLLCSIPSEQVRHLQGDGYLHRRNPGSVMNASKWHRGPRHYEAMKQFAAELRQRSAVDASVQQELHRRTVQAASNALYDGFFMEKQPEKILGELSAEGLYPYPLQWKTLKISNVKTTISNYVRFLFPVRGYYLLVCKLVRAGLKLYKKE